MAITEWEICRDAVGQGEVCFLLCDDDAAFLQTLRSAVVRTFAHLNLRVQVSAFQRPADIPPQLLETCQLAMLDIDYEGETENGIDFARLLRRKNPNVLIFFVTNYIDYAPAGYEVQAFRYILKRELHEVLERYMLQAMETMAEGRTVLRLRGQEQVVDLPLEQITFIEVMDHYVSIHAGDCVHTLGATLTGMETKLEEHGFLRIHKSYLVNMAHIRKFRSRECLLLDGTALAVSEKNYTRQKQKYLLWKGMK